eukprot:1153271-Pleurochrysis_carterae.AAC.1
MNVVRVEGERFGRSLVTRLVDLSWGADPLLELIVATQTYLDLVRRDGEESLRDNLQRAREESPVGDDALIVKVEVNSVYFRRSSQAWFIKRMLETMHRLRDERVSRQHDASGTTTDQSSKSKREMRAEAEEILTRSFAEASQNGSLEERIKAGDEALKTLQMARYCEQALEKLEKLCVQMERLKVLKDLKDQLERRRDHEEAVEAVQCRLMEIMRKELGE